MTFVNLLIKGDVEEADIDDWVETWHTNVIGDEPLHEILGMTWEEYQQWVGGTAITTIIEQRGSK